jgi:hypothetical protein
MWEKEKKVVEAPCLAPKPYSVLDPNQQAVLQSRVVKRVCVIRDCV